jgi:N-methylhydantoinase A/oxoprolinase/acetone carboxylase beta subunit
MGWAVNVDVGGTFTDAFVHAEDRYATGKARTTPHDLSLGFDAAVADAFEKLGQTLDDGLAASDWVKYATTVGMNALVQRVWPRVGLITTIGQEDTVHLGRSRSWADGLPIGAQMDRTRAQRPPELVPKAMRVGVRERVDCFGQVVMPLQPADVVEAVDYLIGHGAEAIAVCLSWSFMNPAHEQQVRSIAREHYPEIYLGRAPVLLSSEVAPKIDEYRRTTTTVLAALLAASTEEHVLDLTDRLRRHGYRRPLLLARNTGGLASPSRTTALHLVGAGGAAGLAGAASLARQYGLDNVIAADIGGTTLDVGLIVDGEPRAAELNPVVDRWRIHLPVISSHSIGAGGGSIASLSELGELRVGPRSAGSVPGPACYDNGGTEPTVTDADVVLGYVDPDYFLGGRMPLNRARAERAIRRRIAEPLGVSVLEAALRIRRLIDGTMGEELYKQTALRGHDPRAFTLFAFGGAGPVHAVSMAEFADVAQVMTFPFGSEFNAFGQSALGIEQTYEQSRTIVLFDPVRQAFLEDPSDYNAITTRLLELASRDMAEEGFAGDPGLRLELEMAYSGQHHAVRHRRAPLRLDGPEAIRGLAADFNQTFTETYGAGTVNPGGGIEVRLFKLTATYAMETARRDPSGRPGGPAAPKALRACCWTTSEPLDTPVFDRPSLPAGQVVQGPALIEDVDTVIAVNPGWSYEVGADLSGTLRRQS